MRDHLVSETCLSEDPQGRACRTCHNMTDDLMRSACGTFLTGTVQRCLEVGTRSQQASLGNAAEKWISSCIRVQASKSVWLRERYRPFYCLIGWKTRTSYLLMSIDEGSWVAPGANSSTGFVAVQTRLGHLRSACVTCYSFLWLSAVLRLASYLDSPDFLLVEQAWHVTQGCNGTAEQSEQASHAINPEWVGTSNRDSCHPNPSPVSRFRLASGDQVRGAATSSTSSRCPSLLFMIREMLDQRSPGVCHMCMCLSLPEGAASRC